MVPTPRAFLQIANKMSLPFANQRLTSPHSRRSLPARFCYNCTMEITWYGHSCFRLTQRRMTTIVTDPYDAAAVGLPPLKLKADVVTISNDTAGHNHIKAVKGVRHILTGPGEYEIGGVFITAIHTNGKGKRPSNAPRNTLFLFDYDGVTVAHLGNMRRVPTQAEIEALGTVHVALVPVGGGGALTASQAAEVISVLEPSIVVPMHYQLPDSPLKLEGVARFLKEMGVGQTTPVPVLKVTPSSIPQELQVVVLENANAPA